MIIGLDSASEPSVTQASAAKAAGIGLWSGYLATKPAVGLYHAWSRAGFENARLCGGTPIGFCSGWDDPVALKALAASWNLRLCLDVESGIRGDGAWVQGFLDASGAGLYGNGQVHPARRAAFHIVAAYFGFDPQATWGATGLMVARPSGPCGWQWEGTHSEFGIGVDRGWYDDWFAGKFSVAGSEITSKQIPRRQIFMAGETTAHLWGRGTNVARSLFYLRHDGTKWGSWIDLGGKCANDEISAFRHADGALHVIVSGVDAAGSVGNKWEIVSRDDGLSWGSWTDLRGEVSGMAVIGPRPTAVATPVPASAPVDLTPVLEKVAEVKAGQDQVAAAVGAVKDQLGRHLAP